MARILLALALLVVAAVLLGRPAAPLPESDAVAWAPFAETRFTPDGPVFPDTLLALDGEVVTLTGFATPLGFRTSRSLLSPYPSSCPFCSPTGSLAVVEVHASAPSTHRPVTARGRLALRRGGDPSQPLYALLEAEITR